MQVTLARAILLLTADNHDCLTAALQAFLSRACVAAAGA